MAFALGVLALAARGAAQTDEIQVYDGGLAPKGKFNLMLHSNFTPDGVKTPAFPDAVISDKSFNGVPEWAAGITDWFEAGLYMPVYSVDKNRGATLDGFKLRALVAAPRAAERTFVYGVNFEFSVNSKHWEAKRITSEVRPIFGWHLHPIDIIVNPILDTEYDGLGNLTFAPATRLAYNLPRMWAVALEEYGELGPIHHLTRTADQSHQLYGVVDHSGKWFDIEAGAGFGLTDKSDRFTLKLMLSRDLN